MKKIFFILTLMTIFMIPTQAQTTDLQLVEKTINDYLDGIINHKPESFKKAFHPTATMKWIDKKFIEVNALEALSEYVTTNDPVKARGNIVAINVVGDAGSAQLEIEYETFSYIDFMHLLKIDGEWKIVSKTYYTKQKDFK